MHIIYSILIPAYKSKFLREAIDSVINQTYKNFELIIVDDHSPEDLGTIVSEYTDNRINYYRNDMNFGAINVVANWNKCLEYASGDYVICMGDDDMLTPFCLSDYNELISKYPSLNVYHTRTILIDEQSNMRDIQEQRPEFETGYSLWWHRWDNRIKQYIGDFLFKRSHLVENGGFYNLPLAWASDDITAVRAAISLGIANCQKPGFQYRVSRATISSSSNERIKAQATEMEQAWYEDVLNNAAPSDPIDGILISLLKEKITNHFKWKYYRNMNNDIKKSLFNTLFWIKRHRKYGIKLQEVFLSVIRCLFC